MNAVLVGYSGLVGQQLLHELVNSLEIEKIYCIGRSPIAIEDSKIEWIRIADLDEIQNLSNLPKEAPWFCCLGTTIKKAGDQISFKKVDLDAVVSFAKKAAENSCTHLSIVSAAGANKESSMFYNQVKGQMEEQVQELDVNSLAFYRPGLLLGERAEFRLGEKSAIIFLRLLDPFLPDRLKKSIATDSKTLAQQMLSSALRPPSGTQILEAQSISSA
jgi:uncharacterized protein YbjT (DUF2867 family)